MKERIHIRIGLPLLLLALTLGTGCKPAAEAPAANEASAEDTASSEPPKSVTADISGDYTAHFSAQGGAVTIGLLGSIKKGTARFVIGASSEGPTETTELATGFVVPFQLSAGTPQDASGGTLSLVRDDDKTEYNDPTYRLYYDTQAKSHPLGHLTFSKVDTLSSGNPLLVRYHLVGIFDYQAAYAPQPSGACVQEAQMYAGTHGPRYPEYKADLCQARKILVKGSFDITEDLPSSVFD